MEYDTIKQNQIKQDYRSLIWLLGVCINASLGAFCLGYFLAYLGTINNIDVILDKYSINIGSSHLTYSLVNGCVPVGAIFGALSTSALLRKFSRRNCFLVTNIIVLFSIGILFIYHPVTLVIGRLLQGIATGIYSAIVPLYINQMVTPSTSNLGALNQIFIAFGEAFSFFWYWLLTEPIGLNDQQVWFYIYYFPLAVLIVQSFFLLTFCNYQTPKYLQDQNKKFQMEQLVRLIFHQKKCDNILSGFRNSLLDSTNTQILRQKTPKLAIIAAIHIAFLQQMTAVNIVAVYGGKIVADVLPSLSKILPICSNILPSFSAVITLSLMKIYGRKCLLQVGTVITIITLSMIATGYFLDDSDLATGLIISALVIFMANFGMTLGPIVWLYIPQIVQPNIIPFSTMVNLLGAAFCIIVFPLATDFLPNTGYLFLFFIAWNIVSLGVNNFILVETKGKSRQSIQQDYRNKLNND